MAIDVAQIESFATVTIGSDPDNPLYEDDTLEAVFVVAEGFDSTGAPINPALFATDSGGWGAEVEMEPEDLLPVTVDTPLLDDGQIILRLALGASLALAGKHRGNVRIFNPDPIRTQQRVIFNFVIQITAEPNP